MAKKIKDLPGIIKTWALQNQVLAGNNPDQDIYLTRGAKELNFDWADSPQGNDFWNDVDDDHSIAYLKLQHPNLPWVGKLIKFCVGNDATVKFGRVVNHSVLNIHVKIYSSFENVKIKYFRFLEVIDELVLEKNEIYTTHLGNIFRWGASDSISYIGTDANKERCFRKGPGNFSQEDVKDYRLATEEERNWLVRCEAANSLVYLPKIGEYWYVEGHENYKAIFKVSKIIGDHIYSNPILRISKKAFATDCHSARMNTSKFKRKATLEEIEWFKACERAGKYVKKPSSISTEPMKPEECYFKKGQEVIIDCSRSNYYVSEWQGKSKIIYGDPYSLEFKGTIIEDCGDLALVEIHGSQSNENIKEKVRLPYKKSNLKPIINFNQNQDGSENTENHGNLDKDSGSETKRNISISSKGSKIVSRRGRSSSGQRLNFSREKSKREEINLQRGTRASGRRLVTS